MKLFDIAVRYLSDIDLTGIDVYVQPVPVHISIPTSQHIGEIVIHEQHDNPDIPFWQKQSLEAWEKLNHDYRHFNNEYYRSVVFTAAQGHVMAISNDVPSPWEAAYWIALENRSIIPMFFRKKWRGTVYPEDVMLKWAAYCESLKNKPFWIDYETGDETHWEVFMMNAYEYVNNKNA